MLPATTKKLTNTPCFNSARLSEPRKMLVATATSARCDFGQWGLYLNIEAKPARLNPIETQTNSRCPNMSSCISDEPKQSACHTTNDRERPEVNEPQKGPGMLPRFAK